MLHVVGKLKDTHIPYEFNPVFLLPCAFFGAYIVFACHQVLALLSLGVVHVLIVSVPRFHLSLKCPQGLAD